VPVSDDMISGLIDLDRADDEGLVAQLTSQLRGLIAAGRLAKGRALPQAAGLRVISVSPATPSPMRLSSLPLKDISRPRTAVVLS